MADTLAKLIENYANPTYLAGKYHYWQGVSANAISHCSPEIATAWLSGWNDAKAEHMLLRSQTHGNGRRVLSEHGDSIL